jgi:hypothetical protein
MEAPTVGAPKKARRWWAAALAGVMVAALGLALVGAGAWFAVVEPLLEQRAREARQVAEGGEPLRRAADLRTRALAEAEARAREAARVRAKAEAEAERRRREAGENRKSAPGDYPVRPESLPGLESPVPRWEFDPTLRPRGVQGGQGR